MKIVLKNIITIGAYSDTTLSRLLSALFIIAWAAFAQFTWDQDRKVWPVVVLAAIFVHSFLFLLRLRIEARKRQRAISERLIRMARKES